MNSLSKQQEIQSYTFGKLTLGGTTFASDVILFPDRVQENWWRNKGHELQRDDLLDVQTGSCDVLLIGTGAHGVLHVNHEAETWLNREGFTWEAHPTAKACDRYNALVREGKRVIAALHLTC